MTVSTARRKLTATIKEAIIDGKTDVSVIVAAWNAAATISRTIASIMHSRPHGIEVQVIVVDDGSNDATATLAERAGAQVLVRPHEGRAAALNAGLTASEGQVLLFTDSDCTVPESWIAGTLAALGHYDGIGGNLWPTRFTVVELAKVLRYVEEFEKERELEGQYDGVCLNGNNMAIRKSAMVKIGGFDENYLHGADADLTRRLLESGFRLLRTTRTRTFHLKVDTLFSFLKTMWKRGSTVRFGMRDHSETPATLVRALFLSPLKWLAVDFSKVSRLRVFGEPGKNWRAFLAPFINLFGGFANGLGRIYFYLKFRREAT